MLFLVLSGCALGVNLVDWPLLGHFNTVLSLWSGSLESESLRNGFVDLSRLIDISDFVLRCFSLLQCVIKVLLKLFLDSIGLSVIRPVASKTVYLL